MTSLLIVSHEELKSQMSGPSIRNWEIAAALSSEHRVTLAAPGRVRRSDPRFDVVAYDAANLVDLVRGHDVVQSYGAVLYQHRVLLEARHLVVDLYAPFELEALHLDAARPIAERFDAARTTRAVLRDLVRAGDIFLCASERQKDFWLGWLDAVGRVNPHTHVSDPGFSSLLRVVPFGIPETPPPPGPPRFRGVIPGIGVEDFVVLWGGGIWDWFDPLTLIRAVAKVAPGLPALRLVFPASDSPSEAVPPMKMAQAARQLSDSLGLTGSSVFFGKAWVPYEERSAMLLEADLGVSIHRDSIENRFSFRTRVLDYLWAGLPVVTTEGDSMADLVGAEDLGAVVGYGDVEGVATAIRALATNTARRRDCGRRSAAVAERFRWAEAVEPLRQYCRAPIQASDRRQMRAMLASGGGDGNFDPHRQGLAEVGRLITRGAQTLRREGAPGIVARGRNYLRRRAGRAASNR